MAVTIAPGVSVPTQWAIDVGKLLGVVANDECWCDGDETGLFAPCEPCQAQELITRGPLVVFHAAVSVDHTYGRPIENVETSLV